MIAKRYEKYIKNSAKKIVPLLIVAVLMFSLAGTALANTCSAGGSSCPDPARCGNAAADGFIQVACAARLNTTVRNNRGPSDRYRLVHDIDLSSFSNWTPIGMGTTETAANTTFRATFDGAGYKITNLRISSYNAGGNGLFGGLNRATITNLTIELSAGGITGTGERKGGLAGNAYNGTVIDNVHVVGVPTLSPIRGGANYIAGLVGAVQASTIKNSSTANLDLDGFSYVAGFIGVGYVGASVDNSHVKNVRINATGRDPAAIGAYGAGFVGALYSANGATVTNSSVDGAVVRTTYSYAAGFVAALYNNASVHYAQVKNVDVRTSLSYAGGFVAAQYNSSRSSNVTVDNATVHSGLNYSGGFVAAFYDTARTSNNLVMNSNVSTSGYWTGGFGGVIYNSSIVTDSFVYRTAVEARNYGAGGFGGLIYDTCQVTRTGVSESNVISRGHSAGGFAGGIHGLAPGARVSVSFAENTNVTGTDRVGGFVGDLSAQSVINNAYANAWTRPPAGTDGNETPGPRPGVGTPAKVTGTGTNVGGFVGRHNSNTASRGIFNTYTAMEVVNLGGAGNGRGAFTGVNTLRTASYRGTSYFDDLSSVSYRDRPTFVGVNTVPQVRWRGDTQQNLNNASGHPQARVTSLMVQRSTFVGWRWAGVFTIGEGWNKNIHSDGVWYIEEILSYPYFLFGVGLDEPNIDTDWERLRYIIGLDIEEVRDSNGNVVDTKLPPDIITIHPFGSSTQEDLLNGILVIQDRRNTGDSNYFINSSGTPIHVMRSVELRAADEATEDIMLYTRSASDGRHFLISGNSDISFEFDSVVINGNNVAGGISVEFLAPRTLTLMGAQIQNCYTTSRGGGVWASESSRLSIVSGTVISYNTAAEGGGVYTLGNIEMTGGSIERNAATNGGGIWNQGTFTLRGGNINNNTATNGGAMWSLGIITITGGNVRNNHAENNGGGIHSGGQLTVSNGSISGNTAAGNGGAVLNSGAFQMANGSITGNRASNGGGVWNSGSFTMINGTVGGAGNTNNTATSNGSNIWNSGRLTTQGGTIGTASNRGVFNIS